MTEPVPAIVQGWIGQLLDPKFLELMEKAPERVDIKLSASRGKIRKRLEITFDGGAGEFVDPGSSRI
jgi:hypothetical protein